VKKVTSVILLNTVTQKPSYRWGRRATIYTVPAARLAFRVIKGQ